MAARYPLNMVQRMRRRRGSKEEDLLLFEPCRHNRKGSWSSDMFQRNSCSGNAFVGLLRNFASGLAVKVVVKLLRSLVSSKMPTLFGSNGAPTTPSACIT